MTVRLGQYFENCKCVPAAFEEVLMVPEPHYFAKELSGQEMSNSVVLVSCRNTNLKFIILRENCQ